MQGVLGDIEMRVRSKFVWALAIAAAIPSVALALEGITCTGSASYYCANSCSLCSPLGGYSCTREGCILPKDVKSGELHFRPRMKN
jgi:hypothetical protein